LLNDKAKKEWIYYDEILCFGSIVLFTMNAKTGKFDYASYGLLDQGIILNTLTLSESYCIVSRNASVDVIGRH
jgi:hypothetical protein